MCSARQKCVLAFIKYLCALSHSFLGALIETHFSFIRQSSVLSIPYSVLPIPYSVLPIPCFSLFLFIIFYCFSHYSLLSKLLHVILIAPVVGMDSGNYFRHYIEHAEGKEGAQNG